MKLHRSIRAIAAVGLLMALSGCVVAPYYPHYYRPYYHPYYYYR